MEFVNKVKQYLEDTFCVKYTGSMEYIIDDDDPSYVFYTLKWPLNPDDTYNPLILAGQFETEDKFFEYIKDQIKNKRFFLYKNFRVIKVTNDNQ